MTKHPDLDGKRFGRWTVIKRTIPDRREKWDCVCDCGIIKSVSGLTLLKGASTSCGCRRKEVSSKPNLQHGESAGGKITSEYHVYRNMIDRCYRPKNKSYETYGARGITVCDRWLNSVEHFIADMGRRPSRSHSIERINNDAGYSPENCKWGTAVEQANNRRSSKTITHQGITLTLAQWGKRLGIDQDTIGMRLKRGWSTDEIFNVPVRG